MAEMTSMQRKYLAHAEGQRKAKGQQNKTPQSDTNDSGRLSGEPQKRRKITVEANVPIPPPIRARKKGRWRLVAEAMEKGDSVGNLNNKDAHNLVKALQRQGRESLLRRLEEGTYRVWAK